MSSLNNNQGARPDDANGIVYVVDDDTTVHKYLTWLLQPLGCEVRAYDDPEQFLTHFSIDARPACLVTDLCMPGLSGLDLQSELSKRNVRLPIIMMSGQAEIRSAVEAMREGAMDFLEKPVDAATLRTRVQAALTASRETIRQTQERAEVTAKLDRLSPRQRLVLDALLEGKPSKVIASDLGLSPKTIDVHRFRLMHVLGAQSLPDLFRLVNLARGGLLPIAGGSQSASSA